MAGDRKASPAEKHARVCAAFEAKVAILEGWARDGAPPGAKIPATDASLRRWTGPDGTLATWADPTITRPGKTKKPDLVERYRRAIAGIQLRQRKSKASRLGELEAEKDVLRRENDVVRAQNAALMGRLYGATERAAQLGDLLRINQRKVAELEELLRRRGRAVPRG